MPVTRTSSIMVKRVLIPPISLGNHFPTSQLTAIPNNTRDWKPNSSNQEPLALSETVSAFSFLISMFYNYREYRRSSPCLWSMQWSPFLFPADIVMAAQLKRIGGTREAEACAKCGVHLDLLSRNINRILIPDLLSPNSKFNEPQWMFLRVSLRACLTPATF